MAFHLVIPLPLVEKTQIKKKVRSLGDSLVSKVLPMKTQRPEFSLQHPSKRPVMIAHGYKPSAGEMQTGGSLGLTASQSHLN